MRFRRGFNILEMMIVVAIMGLLIALSLPNFFKSGKGVYRDICIKNSSL